MLSRLEHQLEGRQYLVGEYTLADIAHAGNIHRLRVLVKSREVLLHKYPNVIAWMEQVENRELQGVRIEICRLTGLYKFTTG